MPTGLHMAHCWKYRENLQEISYASPDYWAAAEN